MSSINGINNVNPIRTAANQSVSRPVAAEPTHQPRSADRLELSGVSQLMKSLKANTDIRTDKVASIRAEIEAGTYETDEKMDIAIGRLMEDL